MKRTDIFGAVCVAFVSVGIALLVGTNHSWWTGVLFAAGGLSGLIWFTLLSAWAKRTIAFFRTQKVGVLWLVAAAAGGATVAWVLGSDRGTLDMNSAASVSSLLQLVDPGLRRNCKPQPTDQSAAIVIAKLLCRDERAGVIVIYSLYRSVAAAETKMSSKVADIGAPTGSCWRDALATQTFTQGDVSDAGRVVCYLRNQEPRLDWLDRGLKVFASAARIDGQRASVFKWWEKGGGIGRKNARQVFPDLFEEELLAQIPTELRETCARDDLVVSGAEAVVACTPGGPVDGLWYVGFGGDAPLTAHVKKRLNAKAARGHMCSGEVGAFGGNGNNKILCRRDADGYWIEEAWSGGKVFMYARGQKRDRLYEWWVKTDVILN